MELEVGAHLAALLQTAPWAALVALALWPEKGVIALLIKRSQAVRIAEVERGKMKEEIRVSAQQGANQQSFPLPSSSAAPQLPPPSGEGK